MLLIPKKTKFRKYQKGRLVNCINKPLTLETVTKNTLTLRTLKFGVLDSKEVLTIKQTIHKILKKKAKIHMKIFTHLPITKKPLEVRMGKGKGNVYKWVIKIKAGTILCEIETFEKNKAIAALKKAQYKLKIPTKIIF